MTGRRILLLALAAVAPLVAPPPAAAAPPARLPAVATIAATVDPALVRARPAGRARVVAALRTLRPDARPQVLLVIGARTDDRGRLWYRVRVAKRPNGTTGWIPAVRVRVRPVRTRIVVRRAARELTVRRGGRVLLRTRAAVGRPGLETPLGQFFVTARFVPDLAYLGDYALETSAFSRLTEWPGGGVVGIHGTNAPSLLGTAASHGCVRVSNRVARRLRVLVPLGAPVAIVA